MPYQFISGIPASGKTYLAKEISDKTDVFYLSIDDLRKEMAKDSKLLSWVNFYWDKNEKEYYEKTPCEKQWDNLVKQSEAFWPFILNKINEVKTTQSSAIFEGVNILPHLAKRDLDFQGIYLLGESEEKIFQRIKEEPRWGQNEQLQKMEAGAFFKCERHKYQEEAKKYGYRCFNDAKKAEHYLKNYFHVDN